MKNWTNYKNLGTNLSPDCNCDFVILSVYIYRYIDTSMKTRRRSSRLHKKTLKRGGVSKAMIRFESEIVMKFLQMLNTIKLYHWKTYSYATHKATDELYASLSTHIDSFVEVLLGKTQNRIKLNTSNLKLKDCATHKEFKKEIDAYKSYLVGLDKQPALKEMSNTDLFNIRDEILASLNQFLYLYTFK